MTMSAREELTDVYAPVSNVFSWWSRDRRRCSGFELQSTRLYERVTV